MALEWIVWRLGHSDGAGVTELERAALDASGLGTRVETYLVRLGVSAGKQDRRLRNRDIVIIGAEVSRVFMGEADDGTNHFLPHGVGVGEADTGPRGTVPRGAFRPASHTVMVELNGATVALLPTVPGHTVTAYVADGMVHHVVIEPKRRSLGRSKKARATLQWRRAVMASLAADGKLHLVGQLDPHVVWNVAEDASGLDPVLAMYAAYGCALAGNEGGLYSLVNYAVESASVTMFDLAMLSGQDLARQVFAPCCPSISLGWSLLLAEDTRLTRQNDVRYMASLQNLASLRMNAEWTTFRSVDIALLYDTFGLREVS